MQDESKRCNETGGREQRTDGSVDAWNEHQKAMQIMCNFRHTDLQMNCSGSL